MLFVFMHHRPVDFLAEFGYFFFNILNIDIYISKRIFWDLL